MSLIHIVKKLRYGTPTGTNTMPSLTDLPDTVRGSVSQDETDPTLQRFYVDQKAAPKDIQKTEEGQVSFTGQFYDFDYDTLEALKGGTSVAGVVDTSPAKWQNGVTFTTKKLAFQCETESGHFLNFYNALLFCKIIGGGGRDQKFMVQVTIEPLLTDDDAGDWELSDTTNPTA